MSENKAMRLYSPGTIAAYSGFGSFPLGALLFGINVSRRGEPLAGRCIVASALLLLGAMVVAGMAGLELPRMTILNIVIALGLWKYEIPRFESDVTAGARTARWWLPLLVFLAVQLPIVIWAFLSSP